MKFIMQHIERSDMNLGQLETILNSHNAQIAEKYSPIEIILIEMDKKELYPLQTELFGKWKIYPDKKYKVPTTKKAIK